MRVLYVLSGGGYGGIERHVQALLGSLDRSRVLPVLCIVLQGGAISDEIAASGVKTHVIGACNGHDFRILPRLLTILKEEKIDLVHAHDLRALVTVSLLFRPRVPLLSSIHCALYPGLPCLRSCQTTSRTIDRRINLYLPVSRATWRSAVDLLGLHPSRGVVFHNPIDLSSLPAKEGLWLREELGLSPETPLVGMVGRMAEQKDWPSFLKVCRSLAEADPRLHFIAAGDGPLRADLETSGDAAALRERLHWLGFRPDARRIIGALDLFLLMSHHEELPTTLLEAFGMKTPVAGFLPIGGTEEVLEHGSPLQALALLHRNRDPGSVVADARRLLASPHEAAAMAERAYGVAKVHFDTKTAIPVLTELYESFMRN